MKYLFLLISLSCLHFSLFAQSYVVPLQDGIYYTHEALQDNDPDISFDSILYTGQNMEVIVLLNPQHPHRIKKLKLQIGRNRPQKIDIQEIWALCFNGVLYIRGGKELIRIIKFGAICHFTFEKIKYTLTDKTMGDLSSGQPTRQLNYNEQRHRARQFVLDFETGEILPFEPEEMNSLFKRDPALYEQFQQEADQYTVLFQYLLAYNRRNPLT